MRKGWTKGIAGWKGSRDHGGERDHWTKEINVVKGNIVTKGIIW